MPSNPFTKSEVDPSFSKSERAVNEMLQRTMQEKPWANQTGTLLPPRFGYDRTEPGWETIMRIDRDFQMDRRMDYSGVRAGYSGSTRPSIGFV